MLLVLMISVLVYVFGWMSAILFSLLFGGDSQIDGFSYSTSYLESSVQSPGARAFYIFETFLFYCFSCLAHGAAVYFVAHFYLNQNPGIEDAFRKAFWKLHYLILVTILIIVIIIIPLIPLFALFFAQAYRNGTSHGMFFLFVAITLAWQTFVVIRTYLVYPIIMAEGLNPWESFKRSWSLTNSGSTFCYLFGVLFVWGLLKFLTGYALSALLLQSYPYTDNKALLVFVKVFDTLLGIFFLAISPV